MNIELHRLRERTEDEWFLCNYYVCVRHGEDFVVYGSQDLNEYTAEEFIGIQKREKLVVSYSECDLIFHQLIPFDLAKNLYSSHERLIVVTEEYQINLGDSVDSILSSYFKEQLPEYFL